MVGRHFAAALVLAFGTPAGAQQPMLPTVAPGETLLQVEATGSARAVPDQAVVTGSVATDGIDGRAALASNSEASNRVIAALRSAGVPDAQIRTDELRVSRRFRKDKDGDDTDEVIGARASDRIKITLFDVTAAGRVIDAMVRAGATDVEGPAFGFRDDRAIRRSARQDAVRHAQAQAADYAAAFGLRPSRILRISERAVRPDGANDVIVTGSRAPSISPGEQEVTVTVWVDYALTR